MFSRFNYSIFWNFLLITTGSILFSFGAKSVVIHHEFITGGIYGLSLLATRLTELFSPGVWYLIFNLPLFLVGWFFVSRRFFLYSLYSIIVVSLASEIIHYNLMISDQLYAAIAGGIICGAGGGIILRSLGSGGGLDIVAIMLNQRYNFGVGKTYLVFNCFLFSMLLSLYDIDTFIASIILVFISTMTLEHVLTLFNQRKIIYIISEKNQEISEILTQELNQGATFIKAQGAYSGKDKLILMAITNNIRLKRLEEAVFTIDEQALFIVENSFNVIGSTFGKRKIY
ncbi:MAG: YitT family protein [Desulfobulbaceae bacterium]|uniref:YitT family protein n=1 Tax=Candidatus Desulfatifera sulfidica TaxID=2841691 RepID=A0A8J6TEH6_9BACT|nr:YitT family protein [Candidatus Desulfatifera sulfidica]